jgi:hypothetical protein
MDLLIIAGDPGLHFLKVLWRIDVQKHLRPIGKNHSLMGDLFQPQVDLTPVIGQKTTKTRL